jgi:putative DNA primase/helicase
VVLGEIHAAGDTDEGTWRRINLIAFIRKIPEGERDKHFRERVLKPELPGILNWALEGLAAYQREGLNPPDTVLDATREYREDMDLIGAWIEECCERDPKAEAKTATLYDNYKSWAEEQVGFIIPVIAFGRDLADRGFKRKKVNRSRGFSGLKLKPIRFGDA